MNVERVAKAKNSSHRLVHHNYWVHNEWCEWEKGRRRANKLTEERKKIKEKRGEKNKKEKREDIKRLSEKSKHFKQIPRMKWRDVYYIHI